MANPLDGFRLRPEEARFLGQDLSSPAGLVARPGGGLWLTTPQGPHRLGETPPLSDPPGQPNGHPKGLAMDAAGRLLCADLGTGRLEAFSPDGGRALLLEGYGPLSAVRLDARGRIWAAVATRQEDWLRALSPRVQDGCVLCLEDDGPRIAADGLAFPADLCFDADGGGLQVAEMTERRVTRLTLDTAGEVTDRAIFGPADTGGFVSGLAFDAEGNLWGTQMFSDRIFALTPEGDFRVILDDDTPEPSRALYEAFARDAVTPNHLTPCGGRLAPWFSTLTFGGADLRDLYLGSMRGSRIPTFRSPVPGLALPHWR